MADNVVLSTPIGTGDTIAADDVGGAKYPYGKVAFGADGTATLVTASVGLPVGDAGGSLTVDDGAGSLTVDGTVAVSAVSGTVAVSAASLPLPSGAATESTLDTRTGSLTETAPATDTASSGINGRLQRIAQRITSLIALLPTSIGQKAKTGSLSVTIASDQVGSAGVAALDVISIQGIAAMTAVKVDGSAVTQPVSLASVPSHAVTNAGTFATQAACAGDVASGSADSGNPIKVGAVGKSTHATAVTDGQRVNLVASLTGKQVILPDAIPENTVSYAAPAGGLVTTGGVTALSAAGAGLRNYIRSVQVYNSHQTIGTEVVIRDGASGTVLHRGWAQQAGGGYAHTFSPPLRGTANTLVEIAEVTATATTGVLVDIQGYTGA